MFTGSDPKQQIATTFVEQYYTQFTQNRAALVTGGGVATPLIHQQAAFHFDGQVFNGAAAIGQAMQFIPNCRHEICSMDHHVIDEDNFLIKVTGKFHRDGSPIQNQSFGACAPQIGSPTNSGLFAGQMQGQNLFNQMSVQQTSLFTQTFVLICPANQQPQIQISVFRFVNI